MRILSRNTGILWDAQVLTFQSLNGSYCKLRKVQAVRSHPLTSWGKSGQTHPTGKSTHASQRGGSRVTFLLPSQGSRDGTQVAVFVQQALLSTQPSSWSQRQWFSKSHTECVNENRNARINWITSISFKKSRINNSHKEMTCASLVKKHAQQEKQTAPDTTATHSTLLCWFLSCSLVKRTYFNTHIENIL